MGAQLAVTWEGLFDPEPAKPVQRADPRCACCNHPRSSHNSLGKGTYCLEGLCCCTSFCSTAATICPPQTAFTGKKGSV